MLRYFIKRSTGEDFEQVTKPPRNNVWVRGNTVTESELRHLADAYGMDMNILRDVLDENELPRVEFRGDDLYVFVRSVERGKHGQIDTTPILLAVKGTVFVNVSKEPIDDARLVTPKVLAHTTDTTSLLLGTFAGVLSEYEDLMQQTAHYIKDTRGRLRTREVTNKDFVKFVTVEDNLNEYHMNLDGMLVVAQRLKENLHAGSDDHEALEDIVLYIHQLLVAVERYRQSIASIRNAYSTIANNTLNHRMKALTVLTLLIALPNLFYGMYGMNVALPFQEQPWVYEIIVTFTVVVVIMVIVIARKRNIF